ncbi:MAG: myo-inosose-2 dehydratase [Alphaproteobacteria bacterium]|nr:myo-inosose-2 dehydratase [Alphaproteobacteria bacterium]
MPVRLGVNPIAWSNDDLRTLGGNTPLEICLSEARAAGFAGIELGHKFPRDPTVLRPILQAHGIELVSGWYSTELLRRDVAAEIEAIREHMTLLKALGCAVIILAETSNAIHGDRNTPLSRSPHLTDREMTALGARLTELADYLADQGLRVAYHHHMGTVVETRDEIDALMAAAGPSVGLLLDTGHALFGGADPLDLARTYKHRVTHIHGKDIRADVMADVRARDLSFLDAVVAGVFTVPGDGCVDYPPVLREAASIGYDGWLVVEAEQDPDKANPMEYAALGFGNLSRLAKNAGLM